MELRQSQRFPVQCPIAYLALNRTGVGTVSNLSRGGCKVASYTPADRRMYLELRIFLTGDPKSTTKVDLATVRWAQEQEFGLEFITMRPEEEERLRRFVSTLETGQSQ